MKCSMKLLYKLNSNNIKYQDDTVSATVIHMSFLSVAFDKKGIMFLLSNQSGLYKIILSACLHGVYCVSYRSQ